MRLSVFTICFLLATCTMAQEGYRLAFQITGLKDTTIYLGNYYGESTYLKDTARVNSKGEFVFESKKRLAYQGVYFLVLNKTKVFEMVVGENQHFSMATTTEDYVSEIAQIKTILNEKAGQ